MLINFKNILGKSIRGIKLFIIICLYLLPSYLTLIGAIEERAVVINEIAWSGTQAGSTDEWIELFNNIDEDIDLSGWRLVSDDGSPDIALSGTILAQGFYLLERTDDDTISDIPADQIYMGALTNSGETLRLLDSEGNTIDTANSSGGEWPAGTDKRGEPPCASMERIDPTKEDTDDNWATNDGMNRNGKDADGNPLNGTPKAINSASNSPPIADFTFSPPDPKVNEIVTFDASLSEDPDGLIASWHWEFGDGAVSRVQTPSHQYSEVGTFTVKLTVTDDDGAQASKAKEITVVGEPNEPPEADFEFLPTEPSTEVTVKFIDRSSDPDGLIVSWNWEFGDGDSSTLQTPSHQYAEVGTFTVKLTITDDDEASDTASKEITVSEPNIPPTADFSFSPTDPTTQDEVQFTDQSSDPDGVVVSWNWDFGDDSTSDLQTPSHQYSDNDTFTITLTVIDDDGAADTVSQDITVANVAPTAEFNFSPEEPKTDEVVAFDASSSTDSDGTILAYEWDFDNDGEFEESADSAKIKHSFSDDGSYPVTLRVTDDDGAVSDALTKTVKVINRSPKASFGYSPEEPTDIEVVQFKDTSKDADGEVKKWEWDFGDGAISSEQNPTHRYGDDGTYTVTLTITDDDGAKDTESQKINVKNVAPEVDFSFSPASPTTQDIIQFTDQSNDLDGYITYWGWDFGDGSNCPKEPSSCGAGDRRNPTHQYLEAGTYIVKLAVIDDDGTLSKVSKEITVK